MLDRRYSTRNFARHKSLASSWAFVVEENAVAGVESIAFAIVYRRPIGKNFRNPIGASRPEWCLFGLRDFLRLAEHFAARSLVKSRANSGFTNRLQDSNRSDASHIGGVFGNVEADAHVALRAEMINFVRLQIVKQLH